ncbi:MAG: flavin-nucleotide-binding protein [Gammaproteobacteria bacterium]|nr:MAG: flavin-nucleotide-binding protein [Gammaproteobacteria bacterium]
MATSINDQTSASPFHAGERAIHASLGIESQVEELGRRMIRDHLTDQHRHFYQSLPYLVVGSSDRHGQPVASLLTGEPGFISSPTAQSMTITAKPVAGDALDDNLRPGSPIGLLGIDFSTRRRNRANGRVTETGRADGGFSLQIDQAFGNCPAYIKKRDMEVLSQHLATTQRGEPVTGEQLTPADRLLIEAAETFFIATHYSGDTVQLGNGTDVSHRGGDPGFVEVTNNTTLLIPDYAGNQHFNTLGNLRENPRTGLLFINFETGDYLQLAGAIEIIWTGNEISRFAGAERLLRFRLDNTTRISPIETA